MRAVAATTRAALLAVMVLAGVGATGSPSSAEAGGPSPGAHRVMLGSVGQTRQEIEQRERETGHRLPGVRVFRRWDEPLFDGGQTWARDTGHTVFLSIKSRRKNGSLIGWRDIANARPGSPLDAEMRRQAAQIKRFRAPVYIVFNHEPDAKTSRPMGGPADFVAAWRRVVGTYRAAGVRNARYVWTLTGESFAVSTGKGLTRADAYYPGDSFVDDIAADTYNWNTCHSPAGSWQSPAALLDPQRRFGLRHPGKGLMLLESGSVEDPARPGRKAQWTSDLAALLAEPAYRQFRVVLHWDDRTTGMLAKTSCDFDYRTSSGAFAAWRAMAASPGFAAVSPCDRRDCAPPRTSHRRERSRLPLIAGGVPVALIVAGLIGLGVHRRRGSAP
jgi:hypothetical protein